MVKICQTGLLILNFEIIPKNTFSGFCQKFPQAMNEDEKFFFSNFQILGPLGCQGWVVIPQNVKKKSQNHCPLESMLPRALWRKREVRLMMRLMRRRMEV
jgi:hypothetical protein